MKAERIYEFTDEDISDAELEALMMEHVRLGHMSRDEKGQFWLTEAGLPELKKYLSNATPGATKEEKIQNALVEMLKAAPGAVDGEHR